MSNKIEFAELTSEDMEYAQWSVIQLMGHVTYAGYAESVTVFGKPMVKLTVPEINGERSIPSFTKFISPNSLYDVTPVAEDFAIKMATKLRKAPIESYEHNQVIAEMAKDYVKKMSGSEVAKMLLNNENGVRVLHDDFAAFAGEQAE